MPMRTTNKTITFHQPFRLEGVDGVLPPADYRVVTDEEIIEGLSFVAYHRVATSIFVPAPFGSAVEMVRYRSCGSRGGASRGPDHARNAAGRSGAAGTSRLETKAGSVHALKVREAR